jgi:hypothetical protein
VTREAQQHRPQLVRELERIIVHNMNH